jgi:hypothetical protein
MSSEDTLEGVGCRTFIMDFLKGLFFSSFVKGTRILIFLSSCSRLKEFGSLLASFVLGARGFDSGDNCVLDGIPLFIFGLGGASSYLH